MISNVLKLKRNIETESYKFIGTVKVEESMPYIVSVLKLRLEYDIIKPELIIENLLPGEPLAVAVNIVNRFIQLGLINENGTLTTLGEEGAKGKVFMPQSGKFTICVTEDPLIRNGVLAIDWGQNAQEDRPKLNNKDLITLFFISSTYTSLIFPLNHTWEIKPKHRSKIAGLLISFPSSLLLSLGLSSCAF